MAAKLQLQGGFHNPLLRIWQARGKHINADCFMYPVFIRLVFKLHNVL